MDDYTGDIRLELLPRTLYFDLSQDLIDTGDLVFNISYLNTNVINIPFVSVSGSTYSVSVKSTNISAIKTSTSTKSIDTSYDTKDYRFKYSITTADDIFAYGSIAFVKVK